MTVHDDDRSIQPAAAAPGARKALDLGAVRDRLAADAGRSYWRSLEEVAQTPEFTEMIHREFPQLASEWHRDDDGDVDGVSRRRFLQLMSASVAFGGLTACTRQPLEKIVPYVDQPEQIVPGRPLYFATAMELDGWAVPLLAESHMGRPTKLEGNPEHPASRGASDLFAQASVLDLYDPDRMQTVSELGRIRTWQAFADRVAEQMAALEAGGGPQLRILTGPVSSPTVRRLIEEIVGRLGGQARWHQYSPLRGSAAVRAARTAFGREVRLRYDFAKADRVVALDADFLTQGPDAIPSARAFATRRRARAGKTDLNRFYAFESTPTPTGSQADHRVPMSSGELARFAADLHAAISGGRASDPRVVALAADLAAHRGRSVVVAGEQAGEEVHLLAHALNGMLGNFGSTVSVMAAEEGEVIDGTGSIAELVEAMNGGEVGMLLVIDGNPVYDAPADLDFAAALQRVPEAIYLGLADNETAQYCHWNLPLAHYLESWADGRSADGLYTLTQPLIEPLYGGRTAAEALALFTDRAGADGRELVRETFDALVGGGDAGWRRALHDGFVAASAPAPITAAVDAGAAGSAIRRIRSAEPAELEIAFRPDPTLLDGRFANNGWLQECPKPFTKLTWDNALLIAPALAQRLGVSTEQLIEVTVGERSLTVPAWVHPGQAEGTVTLHLGYGRSRTGRVGTGTGFDAYRLRTGEHFWHAPVSLRPVAGSYPLASTQLHDNIESDPFQGTNLEGRAAADRHLIREATVDHFEREPDFPHHVGHGIDESLSLMPGFDYSDGAAWGMSVDLATCTGCNACVIACQSENNIPVVGKDEVAMGREMHWMRIDRYYQGELDDPALHQQPVMCMHCEQAPCEVVCPVAATVHSDEGLNDMVYNRCVGTRYCANNCPYKVRRFNFFKYADTETPSLKLMRNPDVTVRTRGVMEKCSYCVQRISKAGIEARKENRRVRDGEVVTACQQACPSEAIVFGDINDPDSAVAAVKAEPHSYGILTELGTRPRTTYVARVTNPNPDWPGAPAAGGSHDGAAHG